MTEDGEVEALRQWLREPDFSVKFRAGELIAWANKRPVSRFERLFARLDATTSETAKLRERVEELSEALSPFAACASHPCIPDGHAARFEGLGENCRVVLTEGDFRRARSVLENSPATLADATPNQKDRSNV